jgi:hypothetical protein
MGVSNPGYVVYIIDYVTGIGNTHSIHSIYWHSVFHLCTCIYESMLGYSEAQPQIACTDWNGRQVEKLCVLHSLSSVIAKYGHMFLPSFASC